VESPRTRQRDPRWGQARDAGTANVALLCCSQNGHLACGRQRHSAQGAPGNAPRGQRWWLQRSNAWASRVAEVAHPTAQHAFAHAHLPGHLGHREPLFRQLHRFQLELIAELPSSSHVPARPLSLHHPPRQLSTKPGPAHASSQSSPLTPHSESSQTTQWGAAGASTGPPSRNGCPAKNPPSGGARSEPRVLC
jgi:hypothetical protein